MWMNEFLGLQGTSCTVSSLFLLIPGTPGGGEVPDQTWTNWNTEEPWSSSFTCYPHCLCCPQGHVQMWKQPDREGHWVSRSAMYRTHTEAECRQYLTGITDYMLVLMFVHLVALLIYIRRRQTRLQSFTVIILWIDLFPLEKKRNWVLTCRQHYVFVSNPKCLFICLDWMICCELKDLWVCSHNEVNSFKWPGSADLLTDAEVTLTFTAGQTQLSYTQTRTLSDSISKTQVIYNFNARKKKPFCSHFYMKPYFDGN